MKKTEVIVLGAGPAGLAFAQQYGEGAMILEKSTEVGGLCRSVEIQDGVFDIGGHSFHTPHQVVHDLVVSLMDGKWNRQARDARVRVAGDIIPYPFQHHYAMLSDQRIVSECDAHVADPALVASSSHFEEWIQRRFGAGVATHFMLPYNRKLWARDLKGMACDWVHERVATNKDAESTKGSARGRTPLLSGSHVSYPSEGGFGEIFKALAGRCKHIKTREEVVHIDIDQRTLHTRAGGVYRWERLVSTIPLPYLARSFGGFEGLRTITPLVEKLEAVSLKVLLLLVKLRSKDVPQRIYIADPDIPPHKVAFNHTSSPSLAQRDHHAISCEVSYSPFKPAPSDEDLLSATIDWLIADRFITCRDDVVSCRVIDVPFGYPVNTPEKPAIIAEIKRCLQQHDIHSIGRFGAWDYANSDECMRQGIALADQLAARGIQAHA